MKGRIDTSQTNNAFNSYRDEIEKTRQTNQATEHSYRPAIKMLTEKLGGGNIFAINEPAQVECGSPDFVVVRDELTIGHIECKDIGSNLDQIESTEQLTRYRKGLSNLILTDCLEFRRYVEGDLRESARIGHLYSDALISETNGITETGTLFREFLTCEPPKVSNAKELAMRMAAKARLLQEGINQILKDENDAGPLSELLRAYREVLINKLNRSEFADLQAQTAAYGLFAARCVHDRKHGAFTRKSAIFTETTPFLSEIFNKIAGHSIDPRISWIVDDLALLLDKADIEKILENFGTQSQAEDPVIHFYEDFLATYNPKLRETRGVYYTPKPVVDYIVKSLDKLIISRFNLADGLASTEKTDSSTHRVMILDPAVGTGTFLKSVISHIREFVISKGMAGAWPDYVRDHLIPRIFGFELLIAPYTICHLKLAMELNDENISFEYSNDYRLGVYLTNSLEERSESSTPLFAHEIAREADQAHSIKNEKPVMVILGNPPYSGHSLNKGAWIDELISDYKQDESLQKPAQAKWLNDDYVKFIRFAQWRIERTGSGVLGYVTNHAYHDNPTFRGMRENLLSTFNELYILNLHGNSKKKEKTPNGDTDENVFDIQQGVSINLFIKYDADTSKQYGRVYYSDLWGKRDNEQNKVGKYSWLSQHHILSTEWAEIKPKSPDYFFVPKDYSLIEEYNAAWSLQDIFSPYGGPAPGILTTHDKFAISWTQEEAQKKILEFLNTTSETEARVKWPLCGTNQWDYSRAKIGLSRVEWRKLVGPILYRPFDIRYTVYDKNVAVHHRWERVTSHMQINENMGLCVGKAGQVVGSPEWDVVFFTRLPTDYNLFYRGGNCIFPLYLSTANGSSMGQSQAKLNINPNFIDYLMQQYDKKVIYTGQGDLESTIGPCDIMYYIYAILFSKVYRVRYREFLSTALPRIPIVKDFKLFKALVSKGSYLTKLHSLEFQSSAKMPDFLQIGNNCVDFIRYDDLKPMRSFGQVRNNNQQSFIGINSDVWEYTVGGYKPLQKWLKDRKSTNLTYDDIELYRKLCASIAETINITVEIDLLFEQVGGLASAIPS